MTPYQIINKKSTTNEKVHMAKISKNEQLITDDRWTYCMYIRHKFDGNKSKSVTLLNIHRFNIRSTLLLQSNINVI